MRPRCLLGPRAWPNRPPSTDSNSTPTRRAVWLTRFAAPTWLQELGRTSWFLVGFFALVAGFAWLLGATATIVGPVVAATIIATVTTPSSAALQRHRVPRAAGAALVSARAARALPS